MSGNKLRPAVILFESKFDVTLCFVTSQLHDQQPGDILLNPSQSNGIKKTSLIRVAKIATLDISLSLGKIGALSPMELAQVNEKLKASSNWHSLKIAFHTL